MAINPIPFCTEEPNREPNKSEMNFNCVSRRNGFMVWYAVSHLLGRELQKGRFVFVARWSFIEAFGRYVNWLIGHRCRVAFEWSEE